MRRTSSIAIVVTAMTIGLIAGTVLAQQKGRGGPGFGGATTVVSLAAMEPVQKDIGLSGDVVAKLTSLRDDLTAARLKEFQTAGISFRNFQDQSAEERRKQTEKIAEIDKKLNEEFSPKLKALVSADQHKRLQQIQLQWNLQFRGPGALTYADVASELKLTDEQKKKLDDLQTQYDAKQRELFQSGGGQEAFGKLRELGTERTSKTMELLTAEQKEKLNTLKGSAFDVAQLGFGGTGRRGKGN